MTLYERFLEISGKVEDFILDSFLGLMTALLVVCVILCGIIFGMAWAFSDKTDHGECLQSHREPYTTVVNVNKIMVPVTNYRNVCDVWEYPAGVAQ